MSKEIQEILNNQTIDRAEKQKRLKELRNPAPPVLEEKKSLLDKLKDLIY